jgi:SulP family sulfate permease
VKTTVKPEPAHFSELFVPKLITVLREGYDFGKFRADAIAGLTVAIVALPLSMAIAIASGTTPDRGLYAAIVGGFLVSLLGGSRFQIGGPAGAFIVLVAATVARHGVEGMLLATVLAGLILVGAGLLRLGTYIKFIPYPVTVGFTAGIAVIIFASQLHDLFGLSLPGAEPGPFVEKIAALSAVAGTVNAYAVGVAVFTIALIVGLRRLNPTLPGLMIGVVLAALGTALFHLPVETIGSRFGELPRGLQMPALPPISLDRIAAVLPDAVSFALLGAIESLLSAVVADGMTGRRHRSNSELVAQGVANIGSALFGGLVVTGAIARTATNVRAGAIGPVSGMLHSAFLLTFMLVAAPLASFIPLAALAGVLAVVAWNMAERHAFAALVRASWGDALVLLATFLLTVLHDLTSGIVVGVALGSLLFIGRMARATTLEDHTPLAEEDVPDNGTRAAYDPATATAGNVVVYRISGAFFFGAASAVGAVLDRIADQGKTLVLDLSAVPFLDSSAAKVLDNAAYRATRQGVKLLITGASAQDRRTLLAHGLKPPKVIYAQSIDDALKLLRDDAVPA